MSMGIGPYGGGYSQFSNIATQIGQTNAALNPSVGDGAPANKYNIEVLKNLSEIYTKQLQTTTENKKTETEWFGTLTSSASRSLNISQQFATA